ncbi:aldo/keto reductase [Thermodesulfobacteriota bacterium]
MNLKPLKTKSFGNTNGRVTVVGLGGEGILRTYDRETEAKAVIHAALEQGIRYYDCGHVYADSEKYYGAVWQDRPEQRNKIFQASKSASRDKQGALADLEKTLDRMHIDRLDLWQIHDVRTEADLRAISGKGGALEAFVEAKSSGRVRYIGVTGHHDPVVLTRAVIEWPVDAVMLPVNPVEGALGGFLTTALEAAQKKNLATIGMKILGAAHYLFPQQGVTATQLIRYALSFDITVAIVGCSSVDEVLTLSEAGRSDSAMTIEERNELTDIFKPHARKLAFYRGAH